MIICPNCKSETPDISKYCDQCGKRLMFCPNCADGQPRRGKRCTKCGALLVEDRTQSNQSNQSSQSHQTHQSHQSHKSHQSSQSSASPEPMRLVMASDATKVIAFKPGGVIGRTAGDYTDVLADCAYVSSTHGRFILHSSGIWLYTDMGSTNGSKINGTPLVPNKNYHLKKGMTLEIGFVKFNVE